MYIIEKERVTIRPKRVYFNDLEKRLLKELKRYWFNQMPSKYDTLEGYLKNIDAAVYFPIITVGKEYEDGIRLKGSKKYYSTYLSLREINQWFLKHGVINGKQYPPSLVRKYYGATSLHYSDKKE